MLFLIILLGLVLGSFISAYTYRAPRGLSVSRGRSKCPSCKKQIAWYDNLPVVSYLLLNGRCRKCKNPISLRYPLIEFSCTLLLSLFYLQLPLILKNISWLNSLSYFVVLPFLLFVALILLVIFVIDWEHQLILDVTVFWPFFISLLLLLLFSGERLYGHLLAGFGSALFLLLINLATFGRGMGLGDVKLALFLGTLSGIWVSFVYMFWAFVIGALVGIILMAKGRKKMKSQIAFGPFLILGFLVAIFVSSLLRQFFIF